MNPTTCFTFSVLLASTAAAQTTFLGQTYPLPAAAERIRSHRLAGDELPELLGARAASGSSYVLGNVSNGGCAFFPSNQLSPGAGNAVDVAVADVLGPTTRDLLVLTDGDAIALYPAPTYSTSSTIATRPGPRELQAVDLDFDGDRDVVVLCAGNGSTPPGLEVFENAAGQLTSVAYVPLAEATATPTSMTIGAFDPDKRPDVAVAYTANGLSYIDVFQTVMVASVPTPTPIDTAVIGAVFDIRDIVSGDFNSDGFADIAAVGAGLPVLLVLEHPKVPVTSSTPFVLAASVQIPGAGQPAALDRADFDCDGDPDLVVVGSSGAHLFFNDDGFSPQSPQHQHPWPVAPAADVVARDFDDDGNPDFALTVPAPFGGPGHIVTFCNERPSGRCCHEIFAGIDDGFDGQTYDIACPRPELVASTTASLVVGFDHPMCNQRFMHTFEDLPANITGGRLRLHVEGSSCGSDNDNLHLGFDDGVSRFAMGIRVRDLVPSGNGTIDLDLSALPGGIDLRPLMSKTRRLDVYSQDDTRVDFMQLDLETCCPGAQQELTLTHTPYVIGETALLTVSGGTPGDLAVFMLSPGYGCTPTLWLPLCVQPGLIAVVPVDSTGSASFALPIPNTLQPCTRILFQAITLGPGIVMRTSCTLRDYVQL